MRAALDEAAKKVDAGTLSAEPDVEAAVRAAIGTTYEGLGQFDAAVRQLKAALDTRQKTGADELLVAQSMFDLARTELLRSNLKDSERAVPRIARDQAAPARRQAPRCRRGAERARRPAGAAPASWTRPRS